MSWNSLHEDSENALDLNMAPDLLKNDCPVGSPKSISFLSSTNSLGSNNFGFELLYFFQVKLLFECHAKNF